MKKFLKKRFLGIPVIVVIATALVATAVLAAVLLTVTQTITQKIVVEPTPPAEGIVAAGIALPDVYELKAFSWTATAPITVTTLQADRYLQLVLPDPSADYSAYSVELLLASKPVGSTLTVGTSKITVLIGTLSDSLQLDKAGVYTFTQTVTGTAKAANASVSTALALKLHDAAP